MARLEDVPFGNYSYIYNWNLSWLVLYNYLVVVFKDLIASTIFQYYIENGSRMYPISAMVVARPGLKPRIPCSASQELNSPMLLLP